MKLLKFYSPSCAPCKALTPLVEELGQANRLVVEGIDVTKEPELAVKYDVRAVPTLVLVGEGGEQITSNVGLATQTTLSEWLGEYL